VRLAWPQRRQGQEREKGAPVVEKLLEQIRQGSKRLEELSKVRVLVDGRAVILNKRLMRSSLICVKLS
jgi:hypothetical protein